MRENHRNIYTRTDMASHGMRNTRGILETIDRRLYGSRLILCLKNHGIWYMVWCVIWYGVCYHIVCVWCGGCMVSGMVCGIVWCVVCDMVYGMVSGMVVVLYGVWYMIRYGAWYGLWYNGSFPSVYKRKK